MNQEKQKKVLVMVAYYGVMLLGIYLGFRFLLPPLMPFLIGFVVAWILHRPTVFLSRKLHIPQKLPAVVLTVLFYVVAAYVILFVGEQIVAALKDLLPRLPDIYIKQLLPFLNDCMDDIREFANQKDPFVAEQIDVWAAKLSESLMQVVTSLSGWLVRFLSGVATAMPMLILRVVLTVISTFFVSLDFDRIMRFFKRLLPEKAEKAIDSIKDKTLHSLKVFLCSYCLIFLMTFVELSIGFVFMKIPYAVWIGLLVAVVDIMPVLGTGLILLPWALIAFLIKDFPLAVGMLLLYVIITAIRNVVEPRLVGRQIGLHPLATLISMFLGMQLFGLIGLFVFPVVLSLLIQFRRDGVLPLPSWMKQRS